MSSRQQDLARAAAARKRGTSRLRAVTAAIGLASLTATGAVAYDLPGATPAASAVTSTGTSSGRTSGSSGAAAKSATAGRASGGLSSTAAPTSSSGPSQVTSGGS